ncbi:MAG: dynamin family protein [Bacteroidaceae bacterium]|nr:dynamin family protein [Bacteroidaceae bacterium]
MNPIEESEKLINTAWNLFNKIPYGREHLEDLSNLEVGLHQPCELAIAGKVKAGKSSFLNVLIGEDLAKVGDLETTATINRFCYGRPEYPNRPVKVAWEDGTITFEGLDFMNSLQGHDTETLKKASQIDYLEYRIEHPLLRELTVVDTPGTGAVVSEHQDVTELYFNLREKHKIQTRACTSKADAVVYLMGAVPNIRDKSFLDDFKKNTEDGMPLNAVGVLSKVDIDAKLLENREEQAQYLTDCLKEQLSTVIPVSAGLYKAVKDTEHSFREWQSLLHDIPKETFDKMLRAEQLFMLKSYSNIPVEKRQDIKKGLHWSIFRTIARVLYETQSVEEAIKTLYEMANIDSVRKTIDDYFFKRSKLIRCTRVLSELYNRCLKVQTFGLFKLRQDAGQFARWERFARQYRESEAAGLADYLKSQYMTTAEIDGIEKEVTKLKATIEQLQMDIQQTDKDFQTLSAIQANKELFDEEEMEEFSLLFGGYGEYRYKEKVWIQERIEFWNGEVSFVFSSVKRSIINSAIEKYNHILNK